ncbi:LysR family transcriptional regulator [Amaricoccus sp.]|uniref:LysR family transcriptional regulator n=1 Tax=Amaricoccus sp. TaxID=1872485 RepID=UPI001B6D92D9|nr:LysR family transcriptional regulator [Amaricoccus sp.]MBP7240946.1 LysR family transcriptional regulator [Amaricoccus sp.]
MQETTLTSGRPDWDDARMFLAIARAGQMLGASRTLGVNQATLSRRMAALEVALGAKLLVRRTHGCELTDAGAVLVESLERVETEILAVQARLQGADAAAAGLVRIGAPDGFGVGFLAPRLSRLADRHPDLTVQLVPTPRGFSLSRREADLAVMVGRPEKGRLVARKLTDYTLGLYASPAYLAANPAPRETSDLMRHRLVGYVEDLIATPALNYAADFLRGWRSTFEITSAVGQVEAVRAGAGIGALHDYLAGRHDLTPVLPELKVVRSYWLAIHENLRDVARVRVAAEFLTETVRESQAAFVRD